MVLAVFHLSHLDAILVDVVLTWAWDWLHIDIWSTTFESTPLGPLLLWLRQIQLGLVVTRA